METTSVAIGSMGFGTVWIYEATRGGVSSGRSSHARRVQVRVGVGSGDADGGDVDGFPTARIEAQKGAELLVVEAADAAARQARGAGGQSHPLAGDARFEVGQPVGVGTGGGRQRLEVGHHHADRGGVAAQRLLVAEVLNTR